MRLMRNRILNYREARRSKSKSAGIMRTACVKKYMCEIVEIVNAIDKSDICNAVLRALPSWFGNEEAIVDYAEKVQQMSFYAAYDEKKAVGFVAVKVHNAYTVEVCVMGILKEYHRQGLGRKLIEKCEAFCASHNKCFLTVKTLDESAHYEPYESTRSFYAGMGFIPLEVFPLYWDQDNPCLFLAKHITKAIG